MAKSGGVRPAPSSSAPIAFDVLGLPAPKGSSQAFAFKRGDGSVGARVVPGGDKKTRERIIGWDGAVRDAAAGAIGSGRVTPPFVAVPLVVSIVFRLARPGGHYGKGKNAGKLTPKAPEFPSGKPDIDKLARTTLDAMTGIIFDDDSRIARLELDKIYATPGREGASIRVARKHAAALDDAQIRGAVSPAFNREISEPFTRENFPGATPPTLRLVPPLESSDPSSSSSSELEANSGGAAGPIDREASRDRIRRTIAGTTFAAESHAMRKHAPAQLTIANLEAAAAEMKRAPTVAELFAASRLPYPDGCVCPAPPCFCGADDFGGPDL